MSIKEIFTNIDTAWRLVRVPAIRRELRKMTGAGRSTQFSVLASHTGAAPAWRNKKGDSRIVVDVDWMRHRYTSVTVE